MSTTLASIGLAGCAVASVPASLRWLRVAQREHYLPGSAARFAWRWWTSRPVEVGAAVLGLGAAIAGIQASIVVLVTAAVVGLGPLGLGVRGRTSPLRWTRRCRTVAAGLAVVLGACVAVGSVLDGLCGAVVAAALAIWLLPVLLDAVLAALVPVEDRLAGRFVRAAGAKVARVRPRIVAITGSYGKTTTKGYVAHLLAGRYSVVASPRSFNNRAGLARTVNDLLVPGTDVLVAEMGAYGPGEIAALCAWLPPTVAIVTAIGPVHLERFKRLERTVAAKAEIAERADVTVLNVDDPRLSALADQLEAAGKRVVRCGAAGVPDGPAAGAGGVTPAAPANVNVTVLRVDGGLALYRDGELLGTREVAEAVLPAALTNAACAAGAALALGGTAEEVLDRLGSLPVPANRLEPTVAPSGAVVLDDTFNANPAGAALALDALARAGAPGGRKVVVTPGMVELGPLQVEENARLARAAAAVATDVVVVARTNRRALRQGVAAAQAAGEHVTLRVVATREDAVALVRAELSAGDAVLYENDLPDHFP